MRHATLALLALLLLHACAAAQDPPATQSVGRFPFLEVDARNRIVRVECEAIHVNNPLEFFLCAAGTNEHESVLRSKVKASHLHGALLMIGLEPGEPVRFSEALDKWLPPHGPPLSIVAEFERDGQPQRIPAYRLMRDIASKREMPPMTWIFAGSRVMDDGVYAADKTGYLISVVNFDLTVIDIPRLASSANETLEWKTNLDLMPPHGAKVTLVITPAGVVNAPATREAEAVAPEKIDLPVIKIDAQGGLELQDKPVQSLEQLLLDLERQENPSKRVRVAVANAIEENDAARAVINALSRAGYKFTVIPQATASAPPRSPADADAAEFSPERLRQRWQNAVAPHARDMRDAARTHYQVINQLRREQQRLIDQADGIQRVIDELEREYQEMIAPGPE